MMSGDKVWVSLGGETAVDGYSGATPLANVIEGGVNAIPSIMESFIGTIPGSIAETSTLAILIGALVLVISGIGSWRIMLSMLIGGYTMGLIFNGFAETADNLYMAVPAVQQLVMGGFMFGLVFMATDPVSAAQTNRGKWIYGFLTGLLAILIRVVNPAYPEGIMMAILFMNTMAPLVDHYVVAANIKRRMKRLQTA